jgi:protein-tyrosine phosphatase
MENIFWIKSTPPTGLAIVLRPRGDDWLKDEILDFKKNGIDALVSLLEPDEAEMLGLKDEGSLAEEAGIRFLSYPIPDVHVPDHVRTFRAFVADLAVRLCADQRIGVHCRGSIGRATVTAACSLIHLGWKAQDAVGAIQSARGCMVPDTDEQLRWILSYRPQP